MTTRVSTGLTPSALIVIIYWNKWLLVFGL